MTAMTVLLPLSIAMGIAGLLAFMWTLRAGQYEDLDGAAVRILLENDNDEVEAHPNSPQHGAHKRNEKR
jgi:cbb3-type cytochrome oxidase maturation protein